MKVIVAGFPKTGTKSMNAALTKLGYKVYDAPENFFLLSKEYAGFYKDGWTVDDFKRIYRNVDAVTDSPACNFWEEIHKAFPDAKIILTMRENEDVWFRSFANQIDVNDKNLALRITEYLSPTFRRVVRTVRDPMFAVHYGTIVPKWRISTKLNEAMAKSKYRAHNGYIIKNAPREKLLVYSCSEGWEPLCKFLGVPVPDCPFPRKNVRGNVIEEFVKESPFFAKIQREAMSAFLMLALASSVGGYLLFKFGPKGIYEKSCSLLGRLWQNGSLWEKHIA